MPWPYSPSIYDHEPPCVKGVNVFSFTITFPHHICTHEYINHHQPYAEWAIAYGITIMNGES